MTTRKYDQSQKPPVEKTGLTIGMGMTEKQGGTDVRANTTRAERAGSGIYRLTGHKWFMSAPMCDAFLVLAQTPEGLSCFLVPRLLGDGSANGLRFQRLKDKLGNRSNASSEVEFVDAFGDMVGEPGAGISTILDMVTLTRLDCALASSASCAPRSPKPCTTPAAAGLRQDADRPADDDAGAGRHGARCRRRDGTVLPAGRAFDKAASDRGEAAFARVMTPVAKYWCCKIAPALIYEAMECLGGNGYVEEAPIARHYREAPVNAIWEGSGNVMALDVLRVLSRAPGSVRRGAGRHQPRSRPGGQGDDRRAARGNAVAGTDEGAARMLVEQLALAAAAAELYRLGAGRIADAFIETRLAGGWRSTYGMLDSRLDARMIIDMLYPPVN